MAQHKLRMHFWHNGNLVTHEHHFNSYEDASEFAFQIVKPSLLKIYNEYNELIYEVTAGMFDPADSYA